MYEVLPGKYWGIHYKSTRIDIPMSILHIYSTSMMDGELAQVHVTPWQWHSRMSMIHCTLIIGVQQLKHEWVHQMLLL